MRRIALTLCLTLFVLPALSAQQAQTPPPSARPAPLPTVQAPTTPSTRGGAPTMPPQAVAPAASPFDQTTTTPRPNPPGIAPGAGQQPPASWQNVKIEVAISDSLSADVQHRKSVTMIVADTRSGQVRSNSGEGVINVDARPQIHRDGRILLQLTVEYRPNLSLQQTQQSGASTRTTFSESMSLLVLDGKVMTVSQSSDPGSDRRMTLDVTTTILK
jgi:hypothetical protein